MSEIILPNQKRWKVGIHVVGFEAFTIYAETPEEARDLVISGKGGVPAGQWGPKTAQVSVAEMGTEAAKEMGLEP